MATFLLRLAFFARTLVRLWRSDPNFRTLVILVFFNPSLLYALERHDLL